MEKAFDIAASTYDSDWTSSSIGKAQRSQVWHLLREALDPKERLDILELNCGTGEDGAFLASMGHRVRATDISVKMLDEAMKKFSAEENNGLKFEALDVRKVSERNEKYDLIFSNFGGLNCISHTEFQKALIDLKSLLRPEGSIVLVLINSFCLWEFLYFGITFQLKKMWRRQKAEGSALLGTKQLPIYYFRKKEVDGFMGQKSHKSRGIGCFVPPSYLNHRFPAFLIRILNRIDHALLFFSWPAGFSDHIFIEYKMP